MAVRSGVALEMGRRSTVQVWSGGTHLGSGFFAADGLVLTCAHVVWQQPDRVTLRWEEHELPGEVVVRAPAEFGAGSFYGFPDLAVIRIGTAIDHPVPWLAQPGAKVPRRLTAYGFTTATPDPGVGLEGVELWVAGRSGARYLNVTNAEIHRGMSGGPVLDPATGQVYGVVKGSRDYATPRGGWLIRTAAVQDLFDEHPELLRTTAPAVSLLRPDPGTPLYQLLAAQHRVVDRLPYGLDDRPPPLSSVYVRQHTRRTDEDAHPAPVTDVLRRNRNVLVLGGPGSGKSTLVQHLAVDTAAWWLAADPDADRADAPAAGPVVAVRLSAAGLVRTRAPFPVAVSRAATADLGMHLDSAIEPALFEAPPAPGASWLYLIDGVDEVLDAAERSRLLAVLHDRLAEFATDARFLITSRVLPDGELDALADGVATGTADRYGEYLLDPFDPAGLAAFSRHWFAWRTPDRAEALSAGFLAEVRRARLFSLVQVPLLATIAAIVYERDPAASLPADRTSLYRETVQALLYTRRVRLSTRDELRRTLRPFGPAAESFADWLFDHTEACLEHLAHRFLARAEAPTIEAAQAWVREATEVPAGVPLAVLLRELLLGSGLLVAQRDGLGFSHQSFAEYLAAGHAARHFDPSAWLADIDALGPGSRDLFGLARWIQLGNDPVPLLRRLLLGRRTRLALRDGDQSRVRRIALAAVELVGGGSTVGAWAAVGNFCAVLRDGIALPDADRRELLELVRPNLRRIRRLDDEVSLARLRDQLRVLLVRGDGGWCLEAVMRDPRTALIIRIEAARTLVEQRDSEPARQLLRDIAYRRRAAEGRLWAMRTLAAVGTDRDRRYAAFRLGQIVARGDDGAVWMRAAVLLAELGPPAPFGPEGAGLDPDTPEAGRLDAAVLSRIVEPTRALVERVEALDLFEALVQTPIEQPDPSPVTEPLRYSQPDRAAPRLVALRAAAAIAHVRPSAPGSARRAVRILAGDPTYTVLERFGAARMLANLRLDELAAELLLRLAHDPRLPGVQRAEALWHLGRFAPAAARDRLLGWITDPAADPGLRADGLATLVSMDAAAARDAAAVLAGDATLAWGFRAAAARLLADPAVPRPRTARALRVLDDRIGARRDDRTRRDERVRTRRDGLVRARHDHRTRADERLGAGHDERTDGRHDEGNL
ncbi:serine protease [Actinocatenispora sera]|uniref:NACHT domain-containing protein n=1 Tax=Actinocatenispora sera TaxID=390989 RepID=A0A810L2X0_9ACTN|nr:serine protease [Actinocatenispora sera]BCJ28751.1 hypothetical protein Asera_28590 [Actinocatenispora sera]